MVVQYTLGATHGIIRKRLKGKVALQASQLQRRSDVYFIRDGHSGKYRSWLSTKRGEVDYVFARVYARQADGGGSTVTLIGSSLIGDFSLQ